MGQFAPPPPRRIRVKTETEGVNLWNLLCMNIGKDLSKISKLAIATIYMVSAQRNQLFYCTSICINSNPGGGGQICPTVFQMLIPLEPNVGLTSNQAVNSSFTINFWSIKKEISLAGSIWGSIWGSMKVQEGPLSPYRLPQWPKRCSKVVRGTQYYVQCRNGIRTLK